MGKQLTSQSLGCFTCKTVLIIPPGVLVASHYTVFVNVQGSVGHFPSTIDATFSQLHSLVQFILSLGSIFLLPMELRLLYSLSRSLPEIGQKAWCSESKACQMWLGKNPSQSINIIRLHSKGVYLFTADITG